jgi:hypothetical protein
MLKLLPHSWHFMEKIGVDLWTGHLSLLLDVIESSWKFMVILGTTY